MWPWNKSPPRPGLLRRVALVLGGLLLLVLAIPAYYFVRLSFFQPKYDVVSIRTSKSYQSKELLARAWQLPVAQRYRSHLVFQENGSLCGPTSLVNVELSLGVPATRQTILEGTGKCWTGYCMGGLSLDVLAEIARANTGHKVSVLRGLDYAGFRALLPDFNDPTRRYIANFDRGPLFGKAGGHHSPIGGYLEAEDLVFVLDVNQKYEPWLVEPKRLFDAIDVLTPGAKKRGLLLIE